MVKEGRGPAPVPYAVLVLGSAGRGDSLMNADQDNAYVYSPGEPDGPEDHWFAAAGAYLTGVLHVAQHLWTVTAPDGTLKLNRSRLRCRKQKRDGVGSGGCDTVAGSSLPRPNMGLRVEISCGLPRL